MTHITFVLIPGLVSDARVWAPLAGALSGKHSVHHANVQGDDSVRATAARLLEEVGGAIVAVGHSMGGRIALEMAHQAPERIRALVLSNTGHYAKQPGEEAKRQAKVDLGYENMDRLAAEWLPPMLAPGRSADAAIMTDLTEMVLGIGAQVHERQIQALVGRPDAGVYLSDIACPILLLTGAQDGWSPEAQHREIAERAPDTELHVIDGAGHFLPMEQPEKTIETTMDWLERRWEDIDD
jgi:pimeloyl-ACP methyl ester carboxylesterase